MELSLLANACASSAAYEASSAHFAVS